MIPHGVEIFMGLEPICRVPDYVEPPGERLHSLMIRSRAQ